jgi:DNA polymerase I-like protein with 3'-5' exonuclease and polymerase domains
MYAKIFFKEELKDIDVNDVKEKRKDLRDKAKSPEFALNFGGGVPAIMQALQCSKEEAETIIRNYEEGFKGTTEFAKKGSAFVRKNGYILMCPLTGHRMYWWDHDKWLERQKSFTQEFWEEYRNIHKGTGDAIAQEVSMHFRAASKFDRLARNAPPQGTSAVMTKEATTNIFHWIVKNGYFGKILCCALVHDETNWEYPEEVKEFPNIVKSMMESSAAKYCKSIEIPAEASVGTHWIH